MKRFFDLLDGVSSITVIVVSLVLLVAVAISERALERRWSR